MDVPKSYYGIYEANRFENDSKNSEELSKMAVKFNVDAEGNGENGSFATVADAIVDVDLPDVGVTGAKLWLLSRDEVVDTYHLSTELRKCECNFNRYWLRTPNTSDPNYWGTVWNVDPRAKNNGDMHDFLSAASDKVGVRPALTIDLSKVIFLPKIQTFWMKPAGKTLINNRTPQELVNTEEITKGEIQYALDKGDNTAPTEGWSTDIPTGTDVGIYHIWWKIDHPSKATRAQIGKQIYRLSGDLDEVVEVL